MIKKLFLGLSMLGLVACGADGLFDFGSLKKQADLDEWTPPEIEKEKPIPTALGDLLVITYNPSTIEFKEGVEGSFTVDVNFRTKEVDGYDVTDMVMDATIDNIERLLPGATIAFDQDNRRLVVKWTPPVDYIATNTDGEKSVIIRAVARGLWRDSVEVSGHTDIRIWIKRENALPVVHTVDAIPEMTEGDKLEIGAVIEDPESVSKQFPEQDNFPPEIIITDSSTPGLIRAGEFIKVKSITRDRDPAKIGFWNVILELDMSALYFPTPLNTNPITLVTMGFALQAQSTKTSAVSRKWNSEFKVRNALSEPRSTWTKPMVFANNATVTREFTIEDPFYEGMVDIQFETDLRTLPGKLDWSCRESMDAQYGLRTNSRKTCSITWQLKAGEARQSKYEVIYHVTNKMTLNSSVGAKTKRFIGEVVIESPSSLFNATNVSNTTGGAQ